MALNKIEKGIRYTGTLLTGIGGVMFLLLMFLGTSDVIGRYIFNKPITGAIEISGVLMAGIVLFTLAYAQRNGAHVIVDMFILHYSPRAKAIANFTTLLLSLVLYSAIVRQSAIIAVNYVHEHRVFPILVIPSSPFYFFVPVGAFFLCLEFIIQMFQLIPKMRKGG